MHITFIEFLQGGVYLLIFFFPLNLPPSPPSLPLPLLPSSPLSFFIFLHFSCTLEALYLCIQCKYFLCRVDGWVKYNILVLQFSAWACGSTPCILLWLLFLRNTLYLSLIVMVFWIWLSRFSLESNLPFFPHSSFSRAWLAAVSDRTAWRLLINDLCMRLFRSPDF